MRIGLGVLAVLLGLLAYLALSPADIEPVAWQAPPAPAKTAYPENDRLRGIERLAEGIGRGPEGIAIDAEGRIYAGYDDGRVLRFDADGGNAELLANTGGRPLGISVGSKGLFVADADRGLLEIAPDGAVRVLSAEADGTPFRFTDDVEQSDADPALYFTDASARFGYHQLLADIIEHGGSARVLRYDPQSGTTTTLMRGLNFANGVALGPDAAYLLVSETAAYRIWRYWLKGEQVGQQEIFADHLPGFPDNLSIDAEGRVWVAIYAPRNGLLDALSAWPAVRKLIFRLPAFLHPAPVLRSWVLQLDGEGRVVQDLQYHGARDADAPRPYAPITSVVARGNTLYFGSLSATAIGRLVLSSNGTAP